MKKIFLIFAIFFVLLSHSQSVGDYRSVTTGNWTTLSAWQYYNGTAWVTPTGILPQGYPAQFSGTNNVTIQAGTTITFTNLMVTTTFPKLIINGKLSLNGTGNNAFFDIKANFIKVTPGLSPAATIEYLSKGTLLMPTNALFQVGPLGLSGSCTNNQAIKIGATVIATCSGAGNSGVLFIELMNGGGSITAVPTSNSPVCLNNTINLNGSIIGSPGTGLTYSWTITSPTGIITTVNSQNTTVPNAQLGTYTAKLKCTTSYNGSSFTNEATIAVIVSPTSVSGTVSGNQTICTGNQLTNLTLTGNVGAIQWQSSSDNITFTSIAGQTTNTLSGATIGSLTATKYFRALVQSGGCSAVFSNVVTINVNPITVSGTVSGNQTICSGSQPTNLTLVGNVGSIQWQSSNDNVTFASISGQTTNTLSGTTIGNLTATKYFRALVQSGVCASVFSNVVTINVNPTSVSGTVSSNQTICSGFQPSSLTLAGNIGTIQWQSSNDNVSFTSISGQTTNTLSGTIIGNLTATKYFRVLVQSGVCSTVLSNVVSVSITPLSVGGIVSNDQTICFGTNPNDLILSGNVGTVLMWQKSTDSNFTSPTNIANTNSTLTGISIGIITTTTYFRAVVQNGSCSSIYSNYITISAGNSTWNGSSWDAFPSGNTTLIFNGNYNSVADISGCSCIVNSGNVVVNSNHDMQLLGSVSVIGGTLTFENNSNLLQTQNVSNSGNITVKRSSSALKRLDYTMWSTPVVGQNLFNFSPLTISNRFYFFNTLTNLYNVISSPSATNFATAKGYLIRVPNNHPTWATIYNGQFTGVPNNGNISFSLTDGGSATTRHNATGNPYPSAIKIDDFINSNSSNIEGTLWFWRKTNDDNNPVSYSTCTTVGSTVNNGHTYINDNLISVGQGFLVQAKSGATEVNFTNAMRSSDNVNQFFKNSSSQLPTNIDRFWLQLKNSSNINFGQQLIAYVDNATTGYDSGKDGLHFNDNVISLTSVVDNKELSIQARPTFTDYDSFPLNFKTNVVDVYTISINQLDGLFENNQDIFIKDNDLNTIHNLKTEPYSFSSNAGNFANRFEIQYQYGLLSNINSSFNSDDVIAFIEKKELIVKSKNNLIIQIQIYDATGRVLFDKKDLDTLETKINSINSNQILLLKIKTIDNKIVVKKI
ncbi:hypothetical protein [Flavobacterium sp.]|uniref:PKD domain-containing protein n=1 Tax=Flavobacterium sp. TaxID=239 RepID=UPI0037521224